LRAFDLDEPDVRAAIVGKRSARFVLEAIDYLRIVRAWIAWPGIISSP